VLGPSLPQFQKFRSQSHLWDLLEGLPIFEMVVRWSNAFQIGSFWVLKPTFPRISPEKFGDGILIFTFGGGIRA
jgi:hypothetical protein